jgi:hypothetical protein
MHLKLQAWAQKIIFSLNIIRKTYTYFMAQQPFDCPVIRVSLSNSIVKDHVERKVPKYINHKLREFVIQLLVTLIFY